ncbi:MAG: LapA family protein [Steroidobacteraceae bacterium]
MRTRTLLVILIMLLIAAFLVVNWSVFAASAKFSLIFTSIDVPMGSVLLGILTLIALTFGIYSAVSWSAILLEFRRQAKELTVQRTLADQAEASRFTELRSVVHDELQHLADRMTQMHDAFRVEIRDNANSLAATIGELDDRIQRLYSVDRDE